MIEAVQGMEKSPFVWLGPSVTSFAPTGSWLLWLMIGCCGLSVIATVTLFTKAATRFDCGPESTRHSQGIHLALLCCMVSLVLSAAGVATCWAVL